MRIFSRKNTSRSTEAAVNPRELTKDAVEAELVNLRDSRIPGWPRNNYLFRSLRHACAWVVCYASVEADELDSEFVSDEKKYHFVMIRDGDGEFIKFVFRLTTANLGGWTEYGIEVRKSGVFYACRE